MFAEWLDFVLAEKQAAALVRGVGSGTGDWGFLIATAQAVLGQLQEWPLVEAEQLLEADRSLPLIAAARILDSAARDSTFTEDERLELACGSAVAFAAYGNFPSAAAVIKRFPSVATDWGSWADFFEFGVDSEWALAAIQAGAPATREFLAAVGRQWPSVTGGDPLSLALVAGMSVPDISTTLEELAHPFASDSERQVPELARWLWERASEE